MAIDELARLFTGYDAPLGGVDVVTSTGTHSMGEDADADEASLSGVTTPTSTAPDGSIISSAPTPSAPTPTLTPEPESESASASADNLLPNSVSDDHPPPNQRSLGPESSPEPPHAHPSTSIKIKLSDDEQQPQLELRHPLFSISQLRVDRRLLLNRKRQLKMYRVWMQAKFRKL